MKPTDRQLSIVDRVRADGRVTVVDLADTHHVSEMTIRRDLEVLEEAGLVRRVHGGAIAGWNRGYEPPFALRVSQNSEAKARIARRVASLIEEGETVFLDNGTTAMAIAHELASRPDLTIITPNLRAADILLDGTGPRVVCLGGIVRRGERAVIGAVAERNLNEFYFDSSILGVAGVSLQAGLTEFNLDDAALKRIAIEHARRTVIATDRSKLGQITLAAVAPLSRISLLVTDAPEDDDLLVALRQTGAELALV